MTKKNPNKKRNDNVQKEMRCYYGHLLPAGAIRDGRIKYCNNHNNNKKKSLYQHKVNALMFVRRWNEMILWSHSIQEHKNPTAMVALRLRFYGTTLWNLEKLDTPGVGYGCYHPKLPHRWLPQGVHLPALLKRPPTLYIFLGATLHLPEQVIE